MDLMLGAMLPDELGAVVRHGTGTAVDRSALPGLAAASEGNPLFAIEVAQATRPSRRTDDGPSTSCCPGASESCLARRARPC